MAKFVVVAEEIASTTRGPPTANRSQGITVQMTRILAEAGIAAPPCTCVLREAALDRALTEWGCRHLRRCPRGRGNDHRARSQPGAPEEFVGERDTHAT